MEKPIQLLLILFMAVCASVKAAVQGEASRKYIRAFRGTLLFNILFFLFLVGCLALLFRPTVYTRYTLLYGAVIAFFTVAYQSIYCVALKEGPVSLTVLIVNFNVLITTLFSVFSFGDPFGGCQIAGVVFLVAAMILTTKPDKEKKNASRVWFLLAVGAMLSAGTAGCIQQTYSARHASEGGDSSVSLLIVIYLCAAVLSAFLLLLTHRKGAQKAIDGRPVKLLPYAFFVGLALAGYQKGLMVALANIDGSFLYPTYAGIQSLLILLIGIFRFHDRLSVKQWIGVGCGTLSLCLMNLHIF